MQTQTQTQFYFVKHYNTISYSFVFQNFLAQIYSRVRVSVGGNERDAGFMQTRTSILNPNVEAKRDPLILIIMLSPFEEKSGEAKRNSINPSSSFLIWSEARLYCSDKNQTKISERN